MPLVDASLVRLGPHASLTSTLTVKVWFGRCYCFLEEMSPRVSVTSWCSILMITRSQKRIEFLQITQTSTWTGGWINSIAVVITHQFKSKLPQNLSRISNGIKWWSLYPKVKGQLHFASTVFCKYCSSHYLTPWLRRSNSTGARRHTVATWDGNSSLKCTKSIKAANKLAECVFFSRVV